MHHFGFLTPLLWIAVAFVAIQLRHRRKMEGLRLGGRADDYRADDYASSAPYQPAPFTSASSDERRELEALRERVKVLERIATDDRKTHDLAQEIEALRDR